MSVKCPKCQTENPDTQRFCGDCGTQLPVSEEIPAPTKTLEEPKEELTTGSTFAGRYQIIEELGKGGMGRVYRVLDKELNEEVALKLIKPEIAKDKKTIERFKNELKVARRISHRNVGRMYELMEDRGTHFITMEYVPGQDLRGLIRQMCQLTTGKAIAIAKEVCEGLVEAHRQGVVHRDLKPSNVIIDKQGTARILDFGIARSAAGKGITGAGVMIGTPEYMSPEQVEGKEIDQRSDIYSLGIILYEMVTGRVPFEGDTPFTVGIKQKSEVPRPPIEINDQIPEDLNRMILTCMEKDKENRYQNVGELKADLESLEKGIPTTDRVIPKEPQTSEEITVTFKKRWAVIVVPLVVIVAVFLAIISLKNGKEASPSGSKKIIVLPFENLGQAEDDYFAEGIAEAIRSRLSALHSLEPISRNTANQYSKSGKTTQQIREETAADFILGGTVLWAKKEGETDRVRVTPYLTRTSDDTQLWSEEYDRDIEDTLAIQSQIAEQVTQQMDIILLEPEKRALEAKPTENLEAYKAYLRGLDYFDVYLQQDNLKQAIQMFELAVKLDPEFALAYGYLSRCHSLYYHFGYDRTEERMSEAKMAVDRMKELQPNLPEFHLAFGVYLYRCLRKYDRALEELSFAEQGLPNNVEILNLTAFIRSRQGNFIESIRLLKRSLELDPKNAITAINLGQDFMRTRDFLEAEHYFDLTISLAPNQILGYPLKALTLFRSGKEGAREVIESMPRSNDPLAAYAKYIMEMADKNYQAALDIISPVPVEVFTITETFVPKALLEGQALLLMGKMDLAKAAFRDALLLLESEVKKNPQDPSIRSALGLLYADLGRKEDALREGQLAMEICPVSFDAFSGPEYVINYARILAKVGEHEEALDKIDYLLSIPSSLTVRNLQNGSGWAPLHGHPRFKQIIEKYSK